MPTIIDCHAHYDPQLLDLATMLARMDEAGVQRVALIPALNEPIHATPELLLSTMRTLMNSPLRPLANLVHRSTLTRDGDVRILGKVHKVFKQPDNGSVADLVSQRPDRLMGWIFLNPSRPL
ncbi:MAG: hypothetical protein H6741_34675 [Alphaproteobacteria bacterium]|nr:hypothetical protein [Alphaproteobacteria bacterium]